jgi:hypothetical protein
MSPYLPPALGWDDPEPPDDDVLVLVAGIVSWFRLDTHDDDSDD